MVNDSVCIRRTLIAPSMLCFALLAAAQARADVVQLDESFNTIGVYHVPAGTVLRAVKNVSLYRTVYLDGPVTIDTQGYGVSFFGGNLEGPGSLTKDGSGALSFDMSCRCYAGGTTILAGKFWTIGVGHLPRGTVVNNGTLVGSNDGETFVRYDADISGTGSVEYYIRHYLSVDLILAGNSTYTGRTVFSGGVVQIGEGGTTGSIVGDAVISDLLIFNRSDTLVYGGNLSGGQVKQAGAGTLILTGANTYTGGTTISAGILQIGNGGTSGSFVGNVSNAGSLAFNRSDSLAFDGVISGTGSLLQRGTGTLILNGNNTFTGGATVSVGTLVVGDALHPAASLAGGVTIANGAALGGHGVIAGNVSNSGTVSPGASIGTLTVGSYSQSLDGTLKIEVSPTSSDRLHVVGLATLAGALKLDYASGNYGTDIYTILDATNVYGKFMSLNVSGRPDAMTSGVFYGPTSVALVVQPKSGVQFSTDFARNTLNIAATLDEMIFAHLGTQYCREPGAHPRGMSEPDCPAASVWAQAFGGAGSFKGNTSVSDYSTNSAGVVGGYNVRINPGFWLGLTMAYERDEQRVKGGDARRSTDILALGANGGMQLFEGRLDAGLLYVWNEGKSRRDLMREGQTIGIIESKPTNAIYSGTVQYSHALVLDDLVIFGRLGYTDLVQDGFSETGHTSYGFAFGGYDYAALRGNLGLRLSHVYDVSCGTVLVPDISAGVATVIGPKCCNLTARLAAADVTSEFAAPAAAMDRTTIAMGLGITAQEKKGYSLYLRTTGRIGNNEKNGVIIVGGWLRF